MFLKTLLFYILKIVQTKQIIFAKNAKWKLKAEKPVQEGKRDAFFWKREIRTIFKAIIIKFESTVWGDKKCIIEINFSY